VRWQSLIVIGEYIPAGYRNNAIWQLILQYCGRDEDMQNALATVLLEHLLEHDFYNMFPQVVAEVERGNEWVVDLLERCWAFGEAEHQWDQVETLIRQYRATHPTPGTDDQ
jgi:hypothetical protein